jgi:hypothetical protein
MNDSWHDYTVGNVEFALEHAKETVYELSSLLARLHGRAAMEAAAKPVDIDQMAEDARFNFRFWLEQRVALEQNLYALRWGTPFPRGPFDGGSGGGAGGTCGG